VMRVMGEENSKYRGISKKITKLEPKLGVILYLLRGYTPS
jgi:hypothetical protein